MGCPGERRRRSVAENCSKSGIVDGAGGGRKKSVSVRLEHCRQVLVLTHTPHPTHTHSQAEGALPQSRECTTSFPQPQHSSKRTISDTRIAVSVVLPPSRLVGVRSIGSYRVVGLSELRFINISVFNFGILFQSPSYHLGSQTPTPQPRNTIAGKRKVSNNSPVCC
jgi:hypothetical protein